MAATPGPFARAALCPYFFFGGSVSCFTAGPK